ncbi:MAG: biotin--[acetyl-CoA-carboxylase] ligase [Epsilonproteobacteria bacterium]|nr:biotin--[acetyl-CoA-carboxylase] ligase [Campylobacterota bacterium]
MQIHYLDEVDSTQKWLIENFKKEKIKPPFLVYTTHQTNGIGSRENSWIGNKGNLFLSFIVSKEDMPNDLKIESASIYFSMLLKEVLQKQNSALWVKWPNDFYIDDKKCGGTITSFMKEHFICGIGVNLVNAPDGFGICKVKTDPQSIIENFVKKLENPLSWKQVFRNYSVEFYKNKSFFVHDKNNNKVSMSCAKLAEDGSIMINGERIYSLR